MLEQVANVNASASPGESFNFFMVIYGLLLGLAVTELFTGISPFLREEPISAKKIGVLVPLLILIILVEIISTFIDAWDQYTNIHIELDDLFLPTVIAIGYFVVAAISLPRDGAADTVLDRYFLERKRRIIGILLCLNGAVVLSDWAVVGDALDRREYGNFAVWLTGNLWLILSYAGLYRIGPDKGRAVPVCAAFMISVLSFYLAYYIQDPTCLFSQRDRSTRPVCQLSIGTGTEPVPDRAELQS